MAFFEQRFPVRISQRARGGPRFFTGKSYTTAGQRQTNRHAAWPLHQYSIAYPVKTQADFEELRAFFYVVGGDADAFRFRDWSDYQATQAQTALALISGNQYQAQRLYTVGSRTFARPITKLVAGTVRVWRTRSGTPTEMTVGSEVLVDANTGIATVQTGHVAGDTYAWAGQFDVPVAFKDSAALWQLVSGGPSLMVEWPSIELEEVRL